MIKRYILIIVTFFNLTLFINFNFIVKFQVKYTIKPIIKLK